ncbi:hypothetical protein Trydic_g1884 [Trypoxylus dichotomus]
MSKKMVDGGREFSEGLENVHNVDGLPVMDDLLEQEGDDAVSDRFKKFSSGDISLTDEGRSWRPKIIITTDLKEIVETNSSTTHLELAERFSVIDETIRFHFHQLEKIWKLSK